MIADSFIKMMLVLVLITAAYIISRRNINSMITYYAVQSGFIAVIAVMLFTDEHIPTLIWIALLTVVSKVIIIPYYIRKIQAEMNVQRDVEFKYLNPIGSLFLSLGLILLIYNIFSALMSEFSADPLFILGAVIGVSLTFMGLIITFSRKQAITKILGYLTMENGVLLFSLFFPELPLIIEVLIIVDLVILTLLTAMFAFGIDSTMERFHNKINPFNSWSKEED